MIHVSKKSAFLILVLIVLAGTALRFWQLENWMHYQLDQARDYRVIHAAIEKGPAELPLQGPKAAGTVVVEEGELLDPERTTTTLRLGPFFYYLQYVSALIFGDTPVGHVTLLTLLSVMTIPLFYLFVREYFTRYIALIITATLSFSLYFVVYSRFSWNPNLIPFFSLLVGYTLLRATRSPEKGGWWFVACAVSFALLSQLHFLAFTIVPVICVIYLLLVRPRINWRYWVLAIVAFVGLNVPLIINDAKTGGENAKAFFASIREETADNKTVAEQVSKNLSEHVSYFGVVTWSFSSASLPRLDGNAMGCDRGTCSFLGLAGAVLILLTLVLGALQLGYGILRAQTSKQRHFLLLSGVWVIVVFLVFIPLSFDFAPRFFLLQAPFFLIIFGLALHGLHRFQSIMFTRLIFVGVCLLFAFQWFVLLSYFWTLSAAQNDSAFRLSQTDLVLNERTRVTLGQMERVADYVVKSSLEKGVPVQLEAQAEYKRALWERITNHPMYHYDNVADLGTPYEEAVHYLVLRAQSDQSKHLATRSELYEVGDRVEFGTLILYELLPRTYRIQPGAPELSVRESPVFSRTAQVRYLWRQVLEGCRYDYVTQSCE